MSNSTTSFLPYPAASCSGVAAAKKAEGAATFLGTSSATAKQAAIAAAENAKNACDQKKKKRKLRMERQKKQ